MNTDEKNILPKADILSKKLSLLLMMVTDMESVANMKMTSALYFKFLLQYSTSFELTELFFKWINLRIN